MKGLNGTEHICLELMMRLKLSLLNDWQGANAGPPFFLGYLKFAGPRLCKC